MVRKLFFFILFLNVTLFANAREQEQTKMQTTAFRPGLSDDCGQGDDANNFESGYNITASGIFSAADDFFVSAENTLHIESVELNIHSLIMADPVQTIDLHFYEDDNGSPGNLLESLTGLTPYAQVPIGSGGGFNVFAVMLEVDLEFDGGESGAAYWMQPVAHTSETVYWETIIIGILGEPIHTRRNDDPWGPDPDGEQAVFKLYCEVMTPPEPQCMFDIAVDVMPITRIVFAGIDNSSSPVINGTPALEDFTDIEGMVNRGESYTFALEGNTNGDYVHYSTVWIDWNQNGEYEEEEKYIIGPLINSTGTDGRQASVTIEVPEDAELGTTTFRVAKIWDVVPENPCGSYYFGQGEDYSLIVDEELGTSDYTAAGLSFYPNPAGEELFINSGLPVEAVTVYTLLGQQVSKQNPEADRVSLSGLSSGIYLIKARFQNGNSETFKIIKK